MDYKCLYKTSSDIDSFKSIFVEAGGKMAIRETIQDRGETIGGWGINLTALNINLQKQICKVVRELLRIL